MEAGLKPPRFAQHCVHADRDIGPGMGVHEYPDPRRSSPAWSWGTAIAKTIVVVSKRSCRSIAEDIFADSDMVRDLSVGG